MGNQLEVIVKESGLEQSKAKYILENFQNYFEIADEWANKARSIIVKDESQTADMEMARVGRLFLREKRIAVEKSRKELKEQSLREGKAIDGIANVLKALIVPIEEYLEQQEKFVEIREEKAREAKRLEIEKRMEEEQAAKEKAEAEERERIRVENERLKKEAEERERKMAKERKAQEAKLAAERAKSEAERKATEEKHRKEREASEEKSRKEREIAEKKLQAERAKADTERKAAEQKAKLEREKLEAKAKKEAAEKKRIEEELKSQIICPKCHHKFKPNREK